MKKIESSERAAQPLQLSQGGWCNNAHRLVSPNFNARPLGSIVSLLVIHNISLPAGQFGNRHVENLFLNQLDLQADPSFAFLREVQVSSHFFIRRDGQLYQFVSTADRAWHAGVSEFQGRAGCNDFSIGIELEGTDDLPFEATQYQTLASLTQCLLQQLPLRYIVGHEHIAPGRKTDPGPCFAWKQYQDLLHQKMQQADTLVPTSAMPTFPFVL
jgi:AmpD protein